MCFGQNLSRTLAARDALATLQMRTRVLQAARMPGRERWFTVRVFNCVGKVFYGENES